MLISTAIAIGALFVSALSLFLAFRKYTFDKNVYLAEQIAIIKNDLFDLIKLVKLCQVNLNNLPLHELESVVNRCEKSITKGQVEKLHAHIEGVKNHLEKLMNELKSNEEFLTNLDKYIHKTKFVQNPIELQIVQTHINKNHRDNILEQQKRIEDISHNFIKIQKCIDDLNNARVKIIKKKL